MYTVYILKSLKTGRFYIGSTTNLERRLTQHNIGKNISTRGRGPFVVEYSEQYETITGARQREREIKSFKGGNSFKSLLDRASR